MNTEIRVPTNIRAVVANIGVPSLQWTAQVMACAGRFNASRVPMRAGKGDWEGQVPFPPGLAQRFGPIGGGQSRMLPRRRFDGGADQSCDRPGRQTFSGPQGHPVPQPLRAQQESACNV